MARTLDYDPIFGIETRAEFDHATGKIHVGSFQDVAPLLERNKKLRNDEDYSKQGIKRGWFHAASIPQTAIPIIEQKYGLKPGEFLRLKDDKKLAQILNDPELAYFKTTTKHI